MHNLVLGNTLHRCVLNRSTPYHFAHSTALMGTSFIYGIQIRTGAAEERNTEEEKSTEEERNTEDEEVSGGA